MILEIKTGFGIILYSYSVKKAGFVRTIMFNEHNLKFEYAYEKYEFECNLSATVTVSLIVGVNVSVSVNSMITINNQYWVLITPSTKQKAKHGRY